MDKIWYRNPSKSKLNKKYTYSGRIKLQHLCQKMHTLIHLKDPLTRITALLIDESRIFLSQKVWTYDRHPASNTYKKQLWHVDGTKLVHFYCLDYIYSRWDDISFPQFVKLNMRFFSCIVIFFQIACAEQQTIHIMYTTG